jgi:hypothetical protein
LIFFKVFKGTLSRSEKKFELNLNGVKRGSKLDILVENQGRPSFGDDFNEFKV